MIGFIIFFSELKESGNNNNVGPIDGDEVRPPLPVVRETLYDDAMLYGYISFFLLFVYNCLLAAMVFCYYIFCVQLIMCKLDFPFWLYSLVFSV